MISALVTDPETFEEPDFPKSLTHQVTDVSKFKKTQFNIKDKWVGDFAVKLKIDDKTDYWNNIFIEDSSAYTQMRYKSGS